MGNVSAFAQNEHLVGRKVMTIKWDTEARKGNQVVRKLELAEVYVVTKVNGDWLWFNNSVGGWVKRSDVVPFEEAIGHFNRLVQQDPSATNYYNRALAWMTSGKFDIARSDLNEAIQRDSTDTVNLARSHNARGLVFEALGDYDKAIDDFDKSIRLNPQLATAYHNRGGTWISKGAYRKAIRDFSQAIQLRPGYSGYFHGRGLARRFASEYEAAIADLSEAIRLDSRNFWAYYDRGIAWSKKKDFDNAIADYDLAIQLNPRYAGVYYGRGNVWKAKGVFGKAIDDYNEAIRLDPKYFQAYNNLAWVLATCPIQHYRNGEQAVVFARKACELVEWKNDAVLGTLSAAYAAAGDFDEAKKWLRKAIELNPDSHKEIRDKMFAAFEAGKPYVDEPEKRE